MEHAIFAGEVQHAIFAWPDNHSMILSYFFHVRAFLGSDEEVLPAAEAFFQRHQHRPCAAQVEKT
jgi:hypothetical protein